MKESNTKRGPGRPKNDVPWSFKKWYADNKEEFAKKRKARYHSDPAYKEKVLEQNKKRRESKAKSDRVTVGELAKIIGKTTSIINGWERTGTMPRTPLEIAHGSRTIRLYTENMVAAVKDAVDARFGEVSTGDASFRADIINRWQKLGVSCED